MTKNDDQLLQVHKQGFKDLREAIGSVTRILLIMVIASLVSDCHNEQYSMQTIELLKAQNQQLRQQCNK